MKKYLIFLITIVVVLSVAGIPTLTKDDYSPGVYYEHPKPAVQKKCSPCSHSTTSCRYAAWYGRFEPEGKTIHTCNEFNECSDKIVPKGGKMYEYFKWTYREHVCY